MAPKYCLYYSYSGYHNKPTISYLRVCPITYKAATYISHFLLPPQYLAVYSIPGSPDFIIALALPVD